jgi:hypothetical protein
MVVLAQNTNDYYPWWHSPKTPTTIIHEGIHPKHQQLLSMKAFTQNTNDYYPWWHSPKTPTTIIYPWWYSPKTPTTIYPWRYSPKTPTTITHGDTHSKHQRLSSMVELTQNTNNYYP